MHRLRRSASILLSLAALLLIAPRLASAQAPAIAAKFDVNVTTKTAKVDDVVTAKTQKAMKLKDGTAVPKGSKLVGKVTQVQSLQDGSGTSTLNIKFEQVVVKGGAAIPIQGLIVAIGAEVESDDAPGGVDSALGRPGTVSSASHAATPKANPDAAKGSTLEGVALSLSLDGEGASDLRGIKRDIKIDPSVFIKLELQ